MGQKGDEKGAQGVVAERKEREHGAEGSDKI